MVGGVVAKHVIEVKLVQNSNTSSPILVTLEGIVTEVKSEQL